MDCSHQNDTGFYHPRKPWETPLYRLVEEHYEAFERVYADRFQHKYGFWRSVITKAVHDYLSRAEGETGCRQGNNGAQRSGNCGDLREGFARVRCPECGHNMFAGYSCKQRCICPSCHQSRPQGDGLRACRGATEREWSGNFLMAL